MSFNQKSIVLIGATGGLGQAITLQLGKLGAKLALIGRNEENLQSLKKAVEAVGGTAFTIANGFESEDAASTVIDMAKEQLGEIDILINAAGLLDFTHYNQQEPVRIAKIMYVNSIIPMLLSRALLPYFMERKTGHIVNIGSIFGSIGYPHYASYSASKFALRGFSQALRRELFDSNIKVSYIAPRAIKTAMNDDASALMMSELKTTIDNPVKVANEIIDVIHQQKNEHFIGQPESFFAWLNGFIPTLVNKGLIKPTLIARKHLQNEVARRKE